jgi:hypothetical protein
MTSRTNAHRYPEGTKAARSSITTPQRASSSTSTSASLMRSTAARRDVYEGHCQVDERRLCVWPKSSYPYQITRLAAVETVQSCHVARRSFSMAR